MNLKLRPIATFSDFCDRDICLLYVDSHKKGRQQVKALRKKLSPKDAGNQTY